MKIILKKNITSFKGCEKKIIDMPRPLIFFSLIDSFDK